MMEQFSWMLLELYKAASEVSLAEFQDYVLSLLQALIPFATATWACGRVLSTGVIHHNIHQFGNSPDRLIDDMVFNSRDKAAFSAREDLDRTTVIHAASLNHSSFGVCEDPKYGKLQNVIVASGADEPSGLLQQIVIYRQDTDKPFNAKERRLLHLCLPHFIRALRLNRLSYMHKRTTSTSYVSAIIDRLGVFHHADGCFHELLQREWPSCTDEQLPSHLMQLLNRSKGKQYIGHAIVICIQWVQDLALLNVRRKMPIDALSPRQLEVAHHIAKGLDYKRIAQSLGLSPTTIRNYTQAIHERLQVRSNAELCSKLNAVPHCPGNA